MCSSDLTPLRPTQGSDLGSAPEDDELRFARPQGSDSALASADGLRLTRPRGSDSTLAMEDRLNLGFGGASTSPNLGRRPATSTGGAIITLPRADSGHGGQDRCPIWLSLIHISSGETEILRGRLPLSEARLGRDAIESLEWTDP